MKTKHLVIIALTGLIVYLYYYQNNLTPYNSAEIEKIEQETKNPSTNTVRLQLEKIKDLCQQVTQLENNLSSEIQHKNLSQEKITSLENQLISLAKQKIKNQKEALKLVEKLETEWKSDRENWDKEKQALNQKEREITKKAFLSLVLIDKIWENEEKFTPLDQFYEIEKEVSNSLSDYWDKVGEKALKEQFQNNTKSIWEKIAVKKNLFVIVINQVSSINEYFEKVEKELGIDDGFSELKLEHLEKKDKIETAFNKSFDKIKELTKFKMERQQSEERKELRK